MRHRHMVSRLRRCLGGDAGMSLVELGVSMVITSLLAVLMVTWLSAGVGSESSQRSYDEALSGLRDVSDRLSREVRAAGYLTTAEPESLSFWLDGDRDGVVGQGESITWAIEGSDMRRFTEDDSENVVLASHLTTGSQFSYDAATPGSVTRVTIDLVAAAETRAGFDLVLHSADIYLRNA